MRFFLRSREVDVVPNILEERRSGDRVIAEVAARQRGLITFKQLRGAGLAPGSISHRVDNGRLHPLYRGVYLVGHAAAAPLARELGALLAIGDDASLSDETAGAFWSMNAVPDVVHVTTARGLRSREGITVHRRSLHQDDIHLVEGLRVTTPARTLLDVATVISLDALERAAEQAQVRGLVTRPAVVAMLARSPKAPGAGALRRALLLDEDPVLLRSKAERVMRRLLQRSGIPQPEVNCRLAGRERDFVWRAQKLVVELDGWHFHSSRWAFERDRQRDAELVALGYRVLRVTWSRLTREPHALLVELERALSVA